MLLRRIIDHVRHQNWTAIAIDFVIVVLGVFVGMQVTNWNEARALREREKTIIQSLTEEFRAIASEEQKAIELSQQLIGFDTKWLEAISRPDTLDIAALHEMVIDHFEGISPQLHEHFKSLEPTKVFSHLTGLALLPEASITFQELVSSGDLGLLRSKALRTALARRNARLEETTNAIQLNQRQYLELSSGLLREAVYQSAAPGSIPAINALLTRPDFPAALRGHAGAGRINLSWYKRVHDETLRVLEILEKAQAP